MTIADHIRLIWPSRTFVARGPSILDISFDDGLPPPTEDELAASHAQAEALLAAEQAAAASPSLVSLRSLQIAMDYQVCDEVDLWIQAINDPRERFRAKAWWTGGGNVRRDHPVVEQFRTALGKSNEQVDAWFADAATFDAL